jgi:hypothetical protein
VRSPFQVPQESYAWTAPLQPLPSQKLDTGLINDPLYRPPDPRAQIKAILSCAGELVTHWSAILASDRHCQGFCRAGIHRRRRR